MQHGVDVPTATQEAESGAPNGDFGPKVKRTPQNLYRIPEENTPLLASGEEQNDREVDDENSGSGRRTVAIAIYVNLAANTILLFGKIAVALLTNSLSVLASLVDAALDFLSTAIVWVTMSLIARQDQYAYPIGRRRLEPLGVVVFSVIMVTSFFQVSLECFRRLIGNDESIVELTIPAIIIMASTVLVKFACWLYCRMIKNSSVQALAQDAMTDVVFNVFSIIFPLGIPLFHPHSSTGTKVIIIVGFYFKVWWLDALGGLLLSLYVIIGWSKTSSEHIRNLSGCVASADERSVLLYLTMRFAKTIKQIQGLQAYHVGDSLNVEVDVVLDESISLRDSHDLGESLQYVLESVPTVDRAFVHLDYASWNLPSHMQQN